VRGKVRVRVRVKVKVKVRVKVRVSVRVRVRVRVRPVESAWYGLVQAGIELRPTEPSQRLAYD